MDKLIKKIEGHVPKKSKAHKELKHLEKEDKKHDKKIEKCDKMMGKKMGSHVKKKKH
jgi:hypothetical protein